MQSVYGQLQIISLQKLPTQRSSLDIEIRLAQLLLDGSFKYRDGTEADCVLSGSLSKLRASGFNLLDTIDSQTSRCVSTR
jgi:hypothetical protein